MGRGDGGDDREPESHAGVIDVGAVRRCAPEWLSQLAHLAGVKDRPAVLHDEPRGICVGARGDANPAAGLIVPDGVVDEVADQMGEQRLAAEDWRVMMILVDGEMHIADRDGVIGKDGRGDLVQLYRAAPDVAAVLGAGEGKEALHQPVGSVEPGPDLAGQVGHPRSRGAGLAGGDLERGAHHGERSAQLMGGISDKSAVRVEGHLKAAEEIVNSVSQPLELVVGTDDREPLVQVPLADALSGCGHGSQRIQHPAGHQPAECDGEDGHDGQRDSAADQ